MAVPKGEDGTIIPHYRLEIQFVLANCLCHVPSSCAGEEPACRMANVTAQELLRRRTVLLNAINISMDPLSRKCLEIGCITTSLFPFVGYNSEQRKDQVHLHVFALAFHTISAEGQEGLACTYWQKWTSKSFRVFLTLKLNSLFQHSSYISLHSSVPLIFVVAKECCFFLPLW